MRVSACNQLEGTISEIVEGALGCIVSLDIGINVINACIPLRTLKSLGLSVGEKAYAVFSSMDVVLAEYGADVSIGYASLMVASVAEVTPGDAEDRLMLVLGDSQVVYATVPKETMALLGIDNDSMVYAMVSPLVVMIGKGDNIDKTFNYKNQLGSYNNPYKLSDGEVFCLTTSNEWWFEFSARGAVDIEYHFPCPSAGHVWSSSLLRLSGKEHIYQFQLSQDLVVECNVSGSNRYTFFARPKCAGELRVIGRQHCDGPNFDRDKWMWMADEESAHEDASLQLCYRIFFEKEEVPALLALLRNEAFLDTLYDSLALELTTEALLHFLKKAGLTALARIIPVAGQLYSIYSAIYEFIPAIAAYVNAYTAAGVGEDDVLESAIMVTLTRNLPLNVAPGVLVEKWENCPTMYGPKGSRGEFVAPGVSKDDWLDHELD